ncbi:MAG TPA: helix-turn-helix domain-containing protein [Candidatus Binatia bacterium]|nr:helix-turn-helix domain-containing protein [Candidatus Binatia bacterium]
MNPKRIGFLGFEGVTASDLTRAADVFAAASLNGGYGNRIACYHVCTIGFTHECFRTESGLALRPDSTLETVSDLDTIILPSGDGLRRSLVSETIADWILACIDQTRRVAAIGAGIYGLAPTGLLDGREVTTHYRYASDVARCFPNLRVDPRRHLVRDGAFYTSSGPHAAIHLALALIEQDYGRHVALAAAQEFMMPSAHGNGQHKLPSPLVFDSQPADRFAELIPWIMRNLHEDLSVNALARRACMSPSHFNRAFKSVFGSAPAEFVENLRINEAKRRLSVPKRTLETIAASVGFSDAQRFQRAFERRFGAKPRSYLKTFHASSTATSNNGEAALPRTGRVSQEAVAVPTRD